MSTPLSKNGGESKARSIRLPDEYVEGLQEKYPEDDLSGAVRKSIEKDIKNELAKKKKGIQNG